MTAVEKFVRFLVDSTPDRWGKATERGRKDLMTYFHLLMPTGDHEVFAFQIRTDREKRLAVSHVRGVAHQKRAVAAAVLFEAWAAVQIEGDEALPSERPDRVERLMLVVQLPSGSDRCVTWAIERNAGTARLGHRQEHEIAGGLFDNLVRREQPQPAHG